MLKKLKKNFLEISKIIIKLIKIFFLNKDYFYISSVSSLSSQLGLAIALQVLLKKNNFKKNFSKYILILHFQNDIDIKCRYQIDFKRFGSYFLGDNNLDIEIIKLNNKIIRLITFLLIQLKSFFNRFLVHKNFILIQTRPGWFNERFDRFYFKSLLKFDDYILIGDGLLSLELYKKPFWLVNNPTKDLFLNLSDYSQIFFLYSLNKFNKIYLDNSKFVKIKSNFVRTNIREFNNKNLLQINSPVKRFIKNFSKNYDVIILYSGSTFFESKRTNLISEICLYEEYFMTLRKYLNFDSIFFKPHPASNIKKLRKIQENKDLIGDIYDIDIFVQIANMPLEVLVDLLLEFNNKLKIYLPVCSSGAFATSIIYKNSVFPLKAFGRTLIEKYIYKEYVNSRLEQEIIINKNIRDLGLKFIK